MRFILYPLLLTIAVVASATAQVTTTADAGLGSLRAAVSSTPDGGSINFAASLSGETVRLTGGEIVIDKALTIDASSLSDGIAISASDLSRVFLVSSTGTLTLKDLTICNGRVGTSAHGGGVMVASLGVLTMDGCTIFDCRAPSGGAICAEGTVSLTRTTVADNFATGVGGAICIQSLGSATLNQCTISDNAALSSRGGIAFVSGTLHLENSIVAGNTAPSDPNLNGSPTSMAGTNLMSGDPNLAPLSDYGGPTYTMPPLADSPVIDAAGMSDPGGTDQRGFPRFVSTQLDIGAVEQGPVTLVNNIGDDVETSTTLRKAIADTTNTPGAVIQFADALSGQTITLGDEELTIPSSADGLSIDATNLSGGIGIDANGSVTNHHVMTISSGANASLHGLTITGGRVNGGIYNDQATLNLYECIVSGNSSTGSGGGIRNDATEGNASLSLHTCIVSDNTASVGGGIRNDGTLRLYACTLSGNSATGSFYSGGGICSSTWQGSTDTYLEACTISNNSALQGGGVLVIGNDGYVTVRLDSCTLADNTASDQGGGICYFFGNAQSMVSLEACTITNNSAVNGGGIYRENGFLMLTDSIVAGNNANTGPDLSEVGFQSLANLQGKNLMSDLTGSNVSAGPSLVVDLDPKLSLLGDYGGPTLTVLPLPGSAAIDAAGSTDLRGKDQRSFPRFVGGFLDIGSVESQGNSDLTRVWPTDWDSDTHAYGMELALGTDPFASDVNSANNPIMSINASGQTVITFGHSLDAHTGTEWVLTRSTDLVNYNVELYRFDGTFETIQ